MTINDESSSQFGNNREYMEFRDYRDFPGKSGLFNLFGVPEVPEGFREVPGGGTLHPDRIRAPTEPSRPNSLRILIFLMKYLQ